MNERLNASRADYHRGLAYTAADHCVALDRLAFGGRELMARRRTFADPALRSPSRSVGSMVDPGHAAGTLPF